MSHDPAPDWPAPLFEHWYAVARADHLRRKPLPLTLLGRHFVLARGSDGAPFALEDRCPHRQVALSAGCLRDGQLQCPYHGWRFDPSGALAALPGHEPGQPLPRIRVPAFPLQQHDGLLWLRPAAHGVERLPTLASELVPAQRRFLWQTQWRGHVVDVMENFLDALHTHYVHAGWLRRDSARRPTGVQLQVDGDRVRVDYRGQGVQSGLVYRLFESRRTGESAHFQLPGSSRLQYDYASDARVCVSLHFSPVDARNTRILASLHVRGRWAPRWAVRALLWPLLAHVGRQDAAILAAQQDNMDRFAGRRHARMHGDVLRPILEDWWLQGRRPDPGHARQLRLWL